MTIHIVLADLGFPVWLRVNHFINLLFIGLLMRSGIQILAAHPRLYWNNACKPETSWLKLTRKQAPKDKLWTSMDEEVSAPPLLALPGKENLGVGRHWHFFSIIFWVLNGLIYVVLLFATGEWQRLIPTSWSIFPQAWHTFLTYITFHLPPRSDFHPYDPLQQLAYAAVVFLLGPFLILTGAAMSPAIEGRFPWYPRLFGSRQAARSLHFLGLLAFVLFTIMHTAMVLIAYFQDNIRDIVLGSEQSSFPLAVSIAIVALLFVFGFYAWASWFSLRHRRGVQQVLGDVVDPIRYELLHRLTSKQHYEPSDATPYFWVNGRPPEDKEFQRLLQNNFADWKLEVSGLVVTNLHLSLDDLRKLPKHTQTTMHNCIQGWTGIAEWGGVALSDVLDMCGVLPNARYIVFTSYQHGKDAYPHAPAEAQEWPFYEVLGVDMARHPQTILAYEMNGEPLPLEHGAPVRLRVETLLGYKMVKYLRSIELVEEYSHIRAGQGGFREDIQFYGRGAEI